MKFIKFGDVILETNNLSIIKQCGDENKITIRNSVTATFVRYETQEECNAEFERLEKMLIKECKCLNG